MRFALSLILLGCGLLTFTAQALPIVLYDNGAPLGTADFNSGFGYSGALYRGDDFLLSGPSTVTGVQFNGLTFSSPVTALEYYIYTAAGTLPGTLLTSGAAADLSTSPDGRLSGYQAMFDLVSPLPLDTGRYFLVLGQGVPSSQFIDQTAAIAPGTSPAVYSESLTGAPGTFTSTATALSFQILGNAGITPAPEPSGFILSGSLIGGVLVLMRRGQRRGRRQS